MKPTKIINLSHKFFVKLIFLIILLFTSNVILSQVSEKIIGDWQNTKGIVKISKSGLNYNVRFLNENYSVEAYSLCDVIYFNELDVRTYVTYYSGSDFIVLGSEKYFRKKDEVKSYVDNWTGNWKNNSLGYLRIKKLTNGHYSVISNCGQDYEFDDELELINGSLYNIIDGKTDKSLAAYEFKAGKIFSNNCQSTFFK
jgi:hypothetical protein